MLTKVERAKIEIRIKKLEVNRDEKNLKVMEREADIERIKIDIEESNKHIDEAHDELQRD